MGMFEDVLAWMDNRRRVAGRNVSDLWNDPYNALQKTAANTLQTVRELPDDPANFLGGGVGGIKGIKLSAQPTRDELAKIAHRLAIHQDVRPGSQGRVASIMEQGLNRGMVDPFEPYLTGKGWSWGRGNVGAEDVYLFDREALKYMGKGNPALKEGNIPLAHFTKQQLDDILSGNNQRQLDSMRDTTWEPPLFPDTTR